MQNPRYPKLLIRSKNELAKQISHENFSKDNALDLINDVLKNFDNYWKDSASSEPEKEKYIRNAQGTKLGLLLQKINTIILARNDKMLPGFIFGGIKNRNHAKAAKHLLGVKRRRSILKIDLQRFFEQNNVEKVNQFFYKNCYCDKRTSKILSGLCCVPLGPKGSNSKNKSIARGFATSPRLAVWCNLGIFLKLNQLVQKRLKGKDPRISIYVDDIGITASRVSKEEMISLLEDIKSLFSSLGDKSLKLNDKKTKIKSHEERMEYAGLTLLRNRLEVGKKARSKRDRLKNDLQGNLPKSEKIQMRRRYRATTRYKKYIETL